MLVINPTCSKGTCYWAIRSNFCQSFLRFCPDFMVKVQMQMIDLPLNFSLSR